MIFLCDLQNTCTHCRQSTWDGMCGQELRPPLLWWSCHSDHSACHTDAGSLPCRCTRPSSGRSQTEPDHSCTLWREGVTIRWRLNRLYFWQLNSFYLFVLVFNSPIHDCWKHYSTRISMEPVWTDCILVLTRIIVSQLWKTMWKTEERVNCKFPVNIQHQRGQSLSK